MTAEPGACELCECPETEACACCHTSPCQVTDLAAPLMVAPRRLCDHIACPCAADHPQWVGLCNCDRSRKRSRSAADPPADRSADADGQPG